MSTLDIDTSHKIAFPFLMVVMDEIGILATINEDYEDDHFVLPGERGGSLVPSRGGGDQSSPCNGFCVIA